MSVIRIATAVVILASAAVAQTIDRGWCPPLPDPDLSKISNVGPLPPPSPSLGAQYLGMPGLFVSVSDRGYVCEVKVVRSVNKQVNDEAIRTAMNWRFRPARVSRERVATVIVMNVPVWQKPDGTVVSSEGITVESPPGTVARKP